MTPSSAARHDRRTESRPSPVSRIRPGAGGSSPEPRMRHAPHLHSALPWGFSTQRRNRFRYPTGRRRLRDPAGTPGLFRKGNGGKDRGGRGRLDKFFGAGRDLCDLLRGHISIFHLAPHPSSLPHECGSEDLDAPAHAICLEPGSKPGATHIAGVGGHMILHLLDCARIARRERENLAKQCLFGLCRRSVVECSDT